MSRRLQIDAEIVEIDASLGIDAERLHHHPVDARVGLAQADPGRLDDMIEQRHHLGDIERPLALPIALAGRLLVMQPVLNRLDAPERLDHLGPQVSRQQRQHVLAADLGAERQRFGGEQPVEGFDIHFGALEFRPGILPMIGGIGAPDDIGGQPALALEPRKRLERR